MQSFAGYGYGDYWHYVAEDVVIPNRGGMVRTWVKKGIVYGTLLQGDIRRDRTADGLDDTGQHTLILNDTDAVKIGDRIGDEDGPIYDVQVVRTYPTGQQLEVRQCS